MTDAHTNGTVVSADDLSRRYGEGDTAVDALRGVSLDVSKGKLTAVMGPSGSGKSTLMHLLAGLDKPTSGSVTIAGQNITKLDDNALTKLRREHIGFVFQFFNLLPMLTAEENVVLPLTIAGEKPDEAWLEGLLEKTGLSDRRTHRPSELSGGQQQRVAIARALVSKPTVVFADEPTGNLDSKTSGEILTLMRDSVDSYGQTTVMVTHDARAAAIADRILFLDDGEIVKDVGRSDAKTVLDDDGVARLVIKVSLRSLWGRKLRTLLTGFAIVLGVATVSGTYVLTDSISHAFDTIFSSIYRNTDAVITGKSAVSKNSTTNLPPFDESLLDKVRAQHDVVAAAIGGVADSSTNLIGKNGKVISFGGAPHLGFSVDPKYPAFSSLTLVSGAWPKDGQVVIDHSTASKKHLQVGQQIGVEAQGGVTKFRISGLVKFGSSNLDIGGATLAGFDLATAQQLFKKQGKLDDIRISRKPGVTEAALLAQIHSILPPQTQVRSGTQQAKTDASDTKSFTSFLQDLPPRVRRHRALRRRLRDRELALDHDRAAHA